MARRATIQLKVHRQLVQGIPLDDPDIECLIQGLRLVTPCTQHIDRLIDLLEQIRAGGRQGPLGPGWTSCRLQLISSSAEPLAAGTADVYTEWVHLSPQEPASHSGR